jgi:excisionase family DNA binding protein
MIMRIPERLLTPGQVARLFNVDRQTVTRWAATGRLGSIRTPGGHHRFRESEVNELLADGARRDSTGRPGDPGGPPAQHHE